jgi:hypothetical protein
MSVFSAPTRPPEAFQVHRQLKSPKPPKNTLPSRDVSKQTAYMSTPPSPVPGADTGKTSKFTAKSPLVTTMGSSKVK